MATPREKMRKVCDLRCLRTYYSLHLEDGNDYYANKVYTRFKNYCLAQYGYGETLKSLQEAERLHKKKEDANA